MCVEIMQTAMLEAAQGADAHVRPEVLQRHSPNTDLLADLIGAERTAGRCLLPCHTTCIHGLTASCQVCCDGSMNAMPLIGSQSSVPTRYLWFRVPCSSHHPLWSARSRDEGDRSGFIAHLSAYRRAT